MRGENRRERVPSAQGAPVPAVPAPVPSIREAVPTRSRPVPEVVHTGSLFPLYRGNGERDRVPVVRISTRPTLTQHACGEHVIVALDAPTAAIVVTLDPYAITAEGEVWALRKGRRTYRLDRDALALRDRWNLPGKPPGPQRAVLAEHACGDVVPPGLRRPTTPAARPATHDKEPPF